MNKAYAIELTCEMFNETLQGTRYAVKKFYVICSFLKHLLFTRRNCINGLVTNLISLEKWAMKSVIIENNKTTQKSSFFLILVQSDEFNRIKFLKKLTHLTRD